MAGNLTKCEEERKAGQEVIDEGAQDADTVQCDVDGSYSQVQCNGFTNVCWCVDDGSCIQQILSLLFTRSQVLYKYQRHVSDKKLKIKIINALNSYYYHH